MCYLRLVHIEKKLESDATLPSLLLPCIFQSMIYLFRREDVIQYELNNKVKYIVFDGKFSYKCNQATQWSI